MSLVTFGYPFSLVLLHPLDILGILDAPCLFPLLCILVVQDYTNNSSVFRWICHLHDFENVHFISPSAFSFPDGRDLAFQPSLVKATVFHPFGSV